ncbi:MAG: hypothetical protein ACRDRJ_53255, partial [Streptosporangiaceae bacterium]
PGTGLVLVSARGCALYMFEPDARRHVTRTGLCAAAWPPVKISHGARLAAGPGPADAPAPRAGAPGEGPEGRARPGDPHPADLPAPGRRPDRRAAGPRRLRPRRRARQPRLHRGLPGRARGGLRLPRLVKADRLETTVSTLLPQHAANTVVFPAFRALLRPAELSQLGEHFADMQREQFGTDGFAVMVGRVAAIEHALASTTWPSSPRRT